MPLVVCFYRIGAHGLCNSEESYGTLKILQMKASAIRTPSSDSASLFQVVPAAYGVPEIHPVMFSLNGLKGKHPVIAWKARMVSRTDCSKARVLCIS